MKKIISHPIAQIIIATIVGLILLGIDKKFDSFPDWLINNLWFIIAIAVLLLVSVIKFIENGNLKKDTNRFETVEKKALEEDKAKLKNELNKEKEKQVKPEHIHKRFETLIKSELKYVAIDYKPFFWIKEEARKEYPQGIGIELMSKIFEPFNVKLINETPTNGHSWKSIFDDFSEGRRNELDFIMTPMYETRSRLYDYNVIYSIPLFYSDIGIYVRKCDDTKDLKLPFDEAIKFIKEKRDSDEKWNIEYLEGEISEILGKKLMLENAKLSTDRFRKYSYKHFKEKLECVASTKKDDGDVIFMEIFKAQSIIEDEKLDLVNILKDNQLVYPVSFVIHKEETVLRNFINLRIAELRKNGELQRIIKDNAFQINIKDEKVIDKVFLQTYNYSLIDEDFRERQIMFSDKIKNEYDVLDKVYGNYIEFQESIEETINNFPIPNGDKLRVLEIGYGTGITTNIILKSSSEMELTLLDNDLGMKKIAEKKIVNGNGHKLDFVTSDIFEYLQSCNDDEFDIVVSAYTIHNFDKDLREKLFKALHQKMKSNAIFINADKYAPDDEDERIEALNNRINKFTKYLIKENKYDLLDEWVSHYINDQAPNKVMKETESTKLLKEIGFIDINIEKPVGNGEMMAILTAKNT